MLSRDRREGETKTDRGVDEVEEGKYRGSCGRVIETWRDRWTKKKLKMGDGQRCILEQSMEGEQWSGEIT